MNPLNDRLKILRELYAKECPLVHCPYPIKHNDLFNNWPSHNPQTKCTRARAMIMAIDSSVENYRSVDESHQTIDLFSCDVEKAIRILKEN